MADINDSASPKGIITFEMIYRAIDKTMKRVDALEVRVLKLEPKVTQLSTITKTETIVKDKTENKETTKK